MKILMEEYVLVIRYLISAAVGALLAVTLHIIDLRYDCDEFNYIDLGKGYYCNERYADTIEDK